METKRLRFAALAAIVAAFAGSCVTIKNDYFPPELEREAPASVSALQFGSYYDGSYREYVGTVITLIDGARPEGADWSLSFVNHNLVFASGRHAIKGETKAWARDYITKTAKVYTSPFEMELEFAEGRVYEIIDSRDTMGAAVLKNVEIAARYGDFVYLVSRPGIRVAKQADGTYKIVKTQ